MVPSNNDDEDDEEHSDETDVKAPRAKGAK
jgi:hypothetical protein